MDAFRTTAANPGLTPALNRSALRDAIGALTRRSEPSLLPGLIEQARLPDAQAQACQAFAVRVARGVREKSRAGGRAGLVQGLLQEFALSSQEGVALMCLAEALLRIPDAATRDALIRDKIVAGDWQRHLGQSPSLFVNAAAWGLLLTGTLVATHSDSGLTATLKRVMARGGEPLIRKGVDMAMRMMGEQFVTGETIDQALANARAREAQGFRYSYDMLGEAAMTAADAQRYLAAYEQAIHAIGRASAGRGIVDGPGISIKLSALHPRYARAQVARVMAELAPRVTRLALLARQYDIGLNIDAEEADRLELSLDLLEHLCFEPGLAGWHGIGFVIQAYQKRCPAVVDFLLDLARRSGHRLMVRLVKGAYWDSEIKRAQVDGQEGYPVYTRKAYTDVAYIACARKLLAAPDAVFPQFATHNAHTLAAIHTLAGPDWHAGQYEFQCLHGMGEPLYEQVVGAGADSGTAGRPCRIYAPVGTHETLLAYLVRRLLENGANSSFVNRIADEDVALEELVEDPVRTVEALAEREGTIGLPHPAIALPRELFGPAGTARANSRGLDLADERTLAALDRAFSDASSKAWRAEPMLARGEPQGPWQQVRNPADPDDLVGEVQEATPADVQRGLDRRHAGRFGLGRDVAGRTRRTARSRCRQTRGRHPRAGAAAGARSRQDLRQCGGRGARGGGLPALLRRRGAARFRQQHPRAARPGGVHQPMELSAGHLHRAGRRRTRGRQRGAGQTRRADTAGGRCRGARAACGRRAAGCVAAAARARRNRGRCTGGRCPRARRALHRLHRSGAPAAAHAGRSPHGASATGAADRRDRRPERDGGRLVCAGRAGRRRHRVVGVRQRRPALLGAASAVRAGRRGRAPARDAQGRGAGAAGRRPARSGHRCRAGDRCRSAWPDRAPRAGNAGQGAACLASGQGRCGTGEVTSSRRR